MASTTSRTDATSSTSPDPLSAALLRGHRFTPRQQRHLRKEILLLRAAVERAEIAETSAELRHKFTHLGWLKWLAPAWTVGRAEVGALGGLMKEYPLLASLASIVLSGPLRRVAARVGGPAAKLGTVALAAWTIYKVWCSTQDDAAQARPTDAAGAAGANDAAAAPP